MEIRNMAASSTNPRQYESITEEEFDEFLDDFARYEKHVPEGAKEIAYDIPLPADGLVVRVWSTIVRGVSRGKGQDAIRAVVWDKEEGQPIGGRKKTLRLGPTDSNPDGWKGNLRPKVVDLFKDWRQYDKVCPECGNRMAVREPGRGDDWDPFWGCTNYPTCDHSEGM